MVSADNVFLLHLRYLVGHRYFAFSQQYSEVEAVYLMSGAYDFTVFIEGRTMRQIAQFVSDKLGPMESVLSTATHFVLKKYKDHGTIISEQVQDERMLITP